MMISNIVNLFSEEGVIWGVSMLKYLGFYNLLEYG